MALADLLRTFERDHAAEVARIRATAARDAAAIETAAETDHAGRVAAAIATASDRQRERADARIAQATHRALANRLAARDALLARLREAVSARLPRLVEGAPALAEALLAAAIDCAGEDPGILRCPPALAGTARARAPSSLEIEVDAAITTGVVVELASTRIEATLDAALDREWPRLACEAVRAVEAAP